MSGKIVNIHGHRIPSTTRITPGQSLHHLRALWVCGELSQESYFLGAIVVGVMQKHDTTRVAFSWQDAMGIYTNVQAKVFTGPLSGDRLEFIIALQSLAYWGFANDIEEYKIDEKDAEIRHFTRSPQLRSDDRWDATTPIFFRLPTVSQEEYAERVAIRFREKMSPLRGAIELSL